jgi:hypothetical protein
MQHEALDSVNRLKRLERTIARLKRRTEQLETVSKKYWTLSQRRQQLELVAKE